MRRRRARFPASPACAASMAAFIARRFVNEAMEAIVSLASRRSRDWPTMTPISSLRAMAMDLVRSASPSAMESISSPRKRRGLMIRRAYGEGDHDALDRRRDGRLENGGHEEMQKVRLDAIEIVDHRHRTDALSVLLYICGFRETAAAEHRLRPQFRPDVERRTAANLKRRLSVEISSSMTSSFWAYRAYGET